MINNIYRNILFIIIIVIFGSCKKQIEVDLPKSRIDISRVFASDANANAAISGLYQELMSGMSFASGNTSGITILGALSSDEIRNFYDYDLDFISFEKNEISPSNYMVTSLWSSIYKVIYQSNSIIEGLDKSVQVTEALKAQLLGEAYFIRAFSHFYLAALFGDIPVVLQTNYQKNAVISRSLVDSVYQQIVSDLLLAKEKLDDKYVSTGRVRVNKSTVRALLARVYLFTEEWSLAEEEASAIISQTDIYELVPLSDVFLNTSNEAIWQLMPTVAGFNTYEGFTFITPNGPEIFVLRNELFNAFETGDERKLQWIGSFPFIDDTYYFPFKYKIKVGADITECSMVFRLAEQYLIRAEARAQRNKLTEAIADVNMIRDRAKLPLMDDADPSISRHDLLTAIQQERRVELFTEWGHRWLDLNRTNTADVILGAIKSGWNTGDKLYPIPQQELNNNPFLGEQNPEY